MNSTTLGTITKGMLGEHLEASGQRVTCIGVRCEPGRVARSAALAVLVVLVTACGSSGGNGDGSSPPPPPPPPPPPTGTSVTGTAAKGLLGNAIVSFYAVDGNGNPATTALATTRTNGQGAFASTVTGTGAVVVAVTTDAQTTMLDELSGNAMPAPTNLLLRAALPALTTTPMAVTPLTEMATAMALSATGGLTVANIQAANSAVGGAMLDGAPVLATLPIDLATYTNATVAQQAQAKLVTAMAVAADEGFATGPSGTPCADASYGARLACMVGGLKSLLTPGASGSVAFASQAAYLVAAYERIDNGLVTVAGGKQPASLGLDVRTTAEKALTSAVEKQAVLLGYSPSASPLANTKALFADLRTNIVNANAGTDIFGIAPTIAEIQDDVTTNVQPAMSGTRAVIVAAHTAAGLVDASTVGEYEWASGHVVCGYDPGVLNTTADTAVCRYGLAREQQVLLVAKRTSPGAYAITTQPLELKQTQVPGPDDPIYAGPSTGTVYAPNAALVPLAATFTFATAPGGAQSGTWRGPIYVDSRGAHLNVELSAAQSADWDPATISGTLTVGGKLSQGAAGIALTEATIGNDSQVIVKNGALVAGSAPSLYGALNVSRMATDRFTYAARVSIGAPLLDKAQEVGIPQSFAVTGSVGMVAAAGTTLPVFNGSVELALQGIPAFDSTLPFSATNTLTAQAQVIGNLALPGGRVLAISVAANGTEVDPTPATPHSLSATYAYSTPSGLARINVSGEYDSTDGYSVVVTTNSGVTANVTRSVSGKVEGTVTASGEKTATISGTTINYSDGTTESIY